jgi:hypothetical protein
MHTKQQIKRISFKRKIFEPLRSLIHTVFTHVFGKRRWAGEGDE